MAAEGNWHELVLGPRNPVAFKRVLLNKPAAVCLVLNAKLINVPLPSR